MSSNQFKKHTPIFLICISVIMLAVLLLGGYVTIYKSAEIIKIVLPCCLFMFCIPIILCTFWFMLKNQQQQPKVEYYANMTPDDDTFYEKLGKIFFTKCTINGIPTRDYIMSDLSIISRITGYKKDELNEIWAQLYKEQADYIKKEISIKPGFKTPTS